MKKIHFIDTSFGESLGANYSTNIKTSDLFPAFQAALDAGIDSFEILGEKRFQSLYLHCKEDAFALLKKFAELSGNTTTLICNPIMTLIEIPEILDLIYRLLKKYGVATIRNYNPFNDTQLLRHHNESIKHNSLSHQLTITMMGLPIEKNNQKLSYVDKVQELLETKNDFESLCFKDCTGTTPPNIFYKAIKEAKKILPPEISIHASSTSIAELGIANYMAALDAGANSLDLAIYPCSGNYGTPDILTMHSHLKRTDYCFDISVKRVMEAENILKKALEPYCKKTTSIPSSIIFTTLAQEILENGNEVAQDEINEIVEKAGFTTSVYPVSSIYYTQAMANKEQGRWKTITPEYGKLISKTFGITPYETDKTLCEIFSQQEKENVTRTLQSAKDQLLEVGLSVHDENILITYIFGEEGIDFLKGNSKINLAYKVEEKSKNIEKEKKEPEISQDEGLYTVNVDGKVYNVQVSEGGTSIMPQQTIPAPPPFAPQATSVFHPPIPSQHNVGQFEVKSPMPGTIVKHIATKGKIIQTGEVILILEAMKMETEVKAEKAGKLIDFSVKSGDSVQTGDVIALFEEV